MRRNQSSKTSSNNTLIYMTLGFVAIAWTIGFYIFITRLRTKDSMILDLKKQLADLSDGSSLDGNSLAFIVKERNSLRGELSTLSAERNGLFQENERLKEKAKGIVNQNQVDSDKIPYVNYLFIIKTSASNSDLRTRIRNSWGNAVKNVEKTGDYFFWNSEKITEENLKTMKSEKEQFQDFLVFDFDDNVLTGSSKFLKAIYYAAAKWRFKYVFFLNDKSLVNIYNIETLSAEWGSNLVHRGIVNSAMPIQTDASSVFYEPEYRDCEHFPPYISGGTAILSYDLILWLSSSTLKLRPLTNWDVALGVWLSSLGDIRPTWEKTILTLHRDSQGKFNQGPLMFSILNDVDSSIYANAWVSIQSAAESQGLKKKL